MPEVIDPLRTWELNSTSTRFDVRAAAPGDGELTIMWITWVCVLFCVSVMTLTIMIAMLRAPRKVRRNTFNTYLFYLVISDFVFSFCCFITCLLNTLEGHYFSEWMCSVQTFYIIFGVGANAWLNATVAWQLYRLLRNSRLHIKYKTPSHSDATKHAMMVYLFVATLACLFIIRTNRDPMAVTLHKGMACLPGEVDMVSSIFFWVGFIPFFILIPLGIVLWTSYQLYKYKMLPKRGRRRTLSLFFIRLVVIFVVMWLPGIFCMFIGASWWSTPWIDWAGGTWGHLQGAASAIAVFLKPDIHKTVMDLLLCREPEEDKEAYRVAVQSISAVLENGSDDGKTSSGKKKEASKGKDSWAQPEDPEQAMGGTRHGTSTSHHGTSHHGTSHRDDTMNGGTSHGGYDECTEYHGDPQAHWPSQRPRRTNPRLARYMQQQLEEIQKEFITATSSESKLTTPSASSVSSKSSRPGKASSVSSKASKSSNRQDQSKFQSNRHVARTLLKALEDDDGDERPIKDSITKESEES